MAKPGGTFARFFGRLVLPPRSRRWNNSGMRQLELFTRAQLTEMRDRTLSRRYSPAAEAFRIEHARHRKWGLARRHAEKLRRLHETSADRRPPHPAARPGPTPQPTTAAKPRPLTPAKTAAGPQRLLPANSATRPGSRPSAKRAAGPPSMPQANTATRPRPLTPAKTAAGPPSMPSPQSAARPVSAPPAQRTAESRAPSSRSARG